MTDAENEYKKAFVNIATAADYKGLKEKYDTANSNLNAKGEAKLKDHKDLKDKLDNAMFDIGQHVLVKIKTDINESNDNADSLGKKIKEKKVLN